MNYTEAQARLEAIRTLPICEINKRQPMLVALIADVVNYETENGKITAEKGNWGLESMPYWLTLGERLADLQFERLGNGHFSAAYWHPMLPGKVIKVGFKKEDSGAAYAAFCRMNQGRDGIPMVYDIQRHSGCYTVVLDELEPLNDWCMGESDKVRDYYAAAREIIEHDCHETADAKPISEGFIKTCEDIRKFFLGIASFDCHSGNMMKDKQGNLVITDPVSFSASDKLKSDVFHCDVDELITEIEAIKRAESIERCKVRKAKNNPQGTFQLQRKARCKRRRKVAKREKRDEKVLAVMRRVQRQADRDERFVKMAVGSHNWRQIWFHHNNFDFAELERKMAANLRANEHQAIAWNMPKGLHIDQYLDRKLQG